MDLEVYLKQNNVWFNFIKKPETIHTKDAAVLSGVDLKRLTKSLIFVDENEKPLLAVVPGDCRVDKEKLKKAAGVSKLSLVGFDDAEKYSGYLPGATPPVGHKIQMKTVIDKKLTNYETIYGGGGTRDLIVELRVEDILKLVNAIIADITEK